MRKLDLDKHIVIFSVAAFILLLELLLILPLEIKKIGEMNKAAAKFRQDIDSVEKDWPNKDIYLASSQAAKAEIQRLSEKFIVPQQESGIFSFISSESKGFGVEIKVLKPSEIEDYVSTKFGKFKYLPINIKAQSQFHDLARFLDYLQSGKLFFEVKEITIKANYPNNLVDIIICGLVKE
ncbi:MAG: hypothetical protein Q8O30_06725 [Candidatus Omnitrophota bacterium]|nr:hypothetical protein [Candidatus Omnitrophota bacterium]